jgi:acyl-CoA thioester hydrolase|tara:strand:- start:1487 stop:1903 length:417 start_codon:yes stop_codon:yes gene_type:complete
VPHSHKVKVRFYELDPYGHLNHSAYVQLFETGRIEMLEQVGLALHEIEKNNFRFVVSQIETAFLKPVEAGSFLTIETEILEMRRASSLWWQQIMDENDVVATQRVRVAITNCDGKPIRAPQQIIEALTPFLSSFKNDE